MKPEHQLYLPAIAEHAKEWVEYNSNLNAFVWLDSQHVKETELLQLMQWIEEKELTTLEQWQEYTAELKAGICNTRKVGSIKGISYSIYQGMLSAHWHERWLAICKVKGWKEKL